MDWKRIEDYFYSKVATVFWSLFLLIGGGTFVFYYAYVGYMPTFDLKSSVAIMAAAASTSVLVFATLALLFVVPFWVWDSIMDSGSKMKSAWVGSEGEAKLFGLLVWFATPVSAIMGLIIAWDFSPSTIFAFLAALIVYLVGIRFRFRMGARQVVTEFGRLLFASLAAALSLVTPMLFMLRLSASADEQSDLNSWVLAVWIWGLLIIVTLATALRPPKISLIYWRAGAGCVSVVAVLYIFGSLHFVPATVMGLYKFGNIEAERVVFKPGACAALHELDLVALEKSGGFCVLEEVLIISRLGDEMYLSQSKGGPEVRFTIPAEEVASWVLKRGPRFGGK